MYFKWHVCEYVPVTLALAWFKKKKKGKPSLISELVTLQR